VLAAGANHCVDIAQIDAASAAITSADYLICQLEIPVDSVIHAIAMAHQAGVKIILNPAPAQELPATVLKQIDYLILNETEASLLSGVNVTDQASASLACQNLLAQGVTTVLLTMGEHGVLTANSGGIEVAPAVRVEVIDTTAAGDTFVGAFAVGMANGLNLSQAVSEAQYTAALTVTKLGAQTSIPQRQEVLDFMRSRSN